MLDKSAYQLILGSASPRRKELLAYLYLPFEIITADITEESREEDPVKWVEDVAIKKSVAIFAQLNFEQYKNPFLITADTIVCLGQKVFGKPQSHEEAKKMLLELSGKEHYVYTAVCLKTQKKQLSFVVGSQVQFTAISNELLNLYVATNEPMDKAGAYGIQASALAFVDKLEGSYSNVVGLPLTDLIKKIDVFLESQGQWRQYFE